MSKYEFKPFYLSTYEDDVKAGWKATYRNDQAVPDDVTVVVVGPGAPANAHLVSYRQGNDKYLNTHDQYGRFNAASGPTVFDLQLYRKAKPQTEFRGVAYVSENGKIISVSPDYHDQEAGTCKAVRCTITLHND